jgi:hypothetical protein
MKYPYSTGDISMSKTGFLYLFRTSGFTKTNMPIYKVGRTARENPFVRLKEYTGANKMARLLHCAYYQHYVNIETYVVRNLKNEPDIHFLPEIGREFFACDTDKIITQAVKLLANEWEVDSMIETDDDTNTYVTQKEGERLTTIARMHGVMPQAILDANKNTFDRPLRKKDRFHVGTLLYLP